MKDHLEVFKTYLTDEKQSSANTVESYLRDLRQFVSYCGSRQIKKMSDVDEAFLQQYFEYLSVMGKSEGTKTRILASLRCYYRCLTAKGITERSPVAAIKLKKNAKKLPNVLDSGEILLLLSQPNGSDYKSIRDKAMLELLYATGIKVSELIELSVTDVNLQIGILHLHGRQKERIVPMYPAAVKAVADYMLHVRPAIAAEEGDRLFTNMNGLPMSRQGFWKIIKHYSETAGIKKEITPHTLRHSFAAHLLENGAPLRDIKEMLGHSDISSTQIYAQLVKNKYAAAYARFHPLAK